MFEILSETLKLIEKYVFVECFLSGTYQRDAGHGGYRLIADRSSITIDWSDEWPERIRRFQKRQLKGKCKSELENAADI